MLQRFYNSISHHFCLRHARHDKRQLFPTHKMYIFVSLSLTTLKITHSLITLNSKLRADYNWLTQSTTISYMRLNLFTQQSEQCDSSPSAIYATVKEPRMIDIFSP
ncbi:hypothetical protein CEXT_796161 [Caerostris extrusa]|uniref:Uncharacterized protein n=1 Tax=Caerostris extrusa TaxID=172846 RepID=A0AAV4T395_CAEEX|nr:hypothetical protein CEXT_796161 [Caerostris extrusa]